MVEPENFSSLGENAIVLHNRCFDVVLYARCNEEYVDSNGYSYDIFCATINGLWALVLKTEEGKYVTSDKLNAVWNSKAEQLPENLDNFQYSIIGASSDEVVVDAVRERVLEECNGSKVWRVLDKAAYDVGQIRDFERLYEILYFVSEQYGVGAVQTILRLLTQNREEVFSIAQALVWNITTGNE